MSDFELKQVASSWLPHFPKSFQTVLLFHWFSRKTTLLHQITSLSKEKRRMEILRHCFKNLPVTTWLAVVFVLISHATASLTATITIPVPPSLTLVSVTIMHPTQSNVATASDTTDRDLQCKFDSLAALADYAVVNTTRPSFNVSALVHTCPAVCDLVYGSGNPDISGVGVCMGFNDIHLYRLVVTLSCNSKLRLTKRLGPLSSKGCHFVHAPRSYLFDVWSHASPPCPLCRFQYGVR